MRRFHHLINFRALTLGLGMAAVAALALSALSGLPFWGCFGLAVAAILVNGWLAAWEDDQPGGFNDSTE